MYKPRQLCYSPTIHPHPFLIPCSAKPLASEGHGPKYGSSTTSTSAAASDRGNDPTPTKWTVKDYLTFWRRKRPHAPSPPRTIHFLRPEQHKESKFCSNRISTSKYNPLTFVPLFLFDQFRRYANLFFLFIAILQVRNSELASNHVGVAGEIAHLGGCDVLSKS